VAGEIEETKLAAIEKRKTKPIEISHKSLSLAVLTLMYSDLFMRNEPNFRVAPSRDIEGMVSNSRLAVFALKTRLF